MMSPQTRNLLEAVQKVCEEMSTIYMHQAKHPDMAGRLHEAEHILNLYTAIGIVLTRDEQEKHAQS